MDFAYDNGTVKTYNLRQTSELSGKKMKQLDPVYTLRQKCLKRPRDSHRKTVRHE